MPTGGLCSAPGVSVVPGAFLAPSWRSGFTVRFTSLSPEIEASLGALSVAPQWEIPISGHKNLAATAAPHRDSPIGWYVVPHLHYVRVLVFGTHRDYHMKYLLLSSTIFLAANTGLMAGDIKTGDPQAGLTYATETCSACHGISDEKSSVPEATPFKEVAHVEGMNAKALLVWMRVLHPTMPAIVPEREDVMNVIAYILSLKDQAAEPRQ